MPEEMTIYLGIILATAITYGLRVSGLVLAKKVGSDNRIFVYVSYITYALMSALVIKLIIQITAIPLSWRLAITLICLTAYLFYQKHLMIFLLLAVVSLSLFPLWY